MLDLNGFLQNSYTAYQCVDEVCGILDGNGFKRLKENEKWQLEVGCGYYVVRDESSVIAFRVGKEFLFNIVASHTDSPCFKLKNNANVVNDEYTKLNVEKYGGGIMSTFIDRPLKVAGRIIVDNGNTLTSKHLVSDFNVTIPSVAIHMKTVESADLNPQVDMLPLLGLGKNDIIKAITDEKVVDYDLYLVSDEKPFYSGVNNEFLSAPRIDNKSSVLSSIEALLNSNGDSINMACCFNNEEVGSSTKQGANSTFLTDVLNRITVALNKTADDLMTALNSTLLISLDNAHSMHPNHTEKCDITNKCFMGKGIVVKHHANQAYTTDGFSSAIIKKIFDMANVEHQDFYNRSDMRSGSTLGAISSSHVSVRSVDLGIAQLAMHSAVECFAVKDYKTMIDGLTAYYNTKIVANENTVTVK